MDDYIIKYFISHEILGEKEVTKEEFIKAERQAGFYTKSSKSDDCATGGFSCGSLRGSLKYIKKEDFK